jgi:U3 small nucleolar ribonucleoprotein component
MEIESEEEADNIF